MNSLIKIWLKPFALITLIITLVYVTIWQVEKSDQIKIKRVEGQSQLNELKTWLGDDTLRLIAQNKINQSYQDLMRNSEITQQPNMAWLRLMVENHGLEFVDFKKIKSNQVSLDIRGSEHELWSFINHIKVENPWIRLKHVQLSMGSKKSNRSKYSKSNSGRRKSRGQESSERDFNINQLILDWPMIQSVTKPVNKNKASIKVNEMSVSEWVELVNDSFFQTLFKVESSQLQEPMYSEKTDSLMSVFTNQKISSAKIKRKNTPSIIKAVAWPSTWEVVGNMPSRGVQIKISSTKNQTHFWKIGTSFEKWTLKEVYSTRGVFHDPQGVRLELNW